VNSIKSRLPLAALIVGLAAASLAACGGGGTGNTTTPSAPIVNNGAGSGSTTQSTGAHISFTYTQGVARPGTSTAATRHIAGRARRSSSITTPSADSSSRLPAERQRRKFSTTT